MLPTHLDYLDGWRGIAISLLLMGHFFPVPGLNLGAAGVHLFFVLSGLLMARLLFVNATPIGLFYKRRVSRVFPAHFAFLGVVVLVFLALGREVRWSEVAAAAFFVNNYWTGDPGHNVMPFGHIWSLCVEEHSYVLLSLIALAVRRQWMKALHALALCAAITACFTVWYWMRYSGTELAYVMRLRTEVSAFGIFASGAMLLYLRNRAIPRPLAMAVPVLMAMALMTYWWSVPLPVQIIVGVSLFALCLNIMHAAPALLRRALAFAPLRQLGLWSFSLYLWQQPFYLYAYRGGMPKWLALLAALGAGTASYYLIERPFRAYLNRAWAAEKEEAPAQPVAV